MSFIEGNSGIQKYYKGNGKIITRWRDQIYSYCICGYVALKPTNEFEERHGGKTIKRSLIIIVDNKTEKIIQKLRPRTDKFGDIDINRFWQCNACVNEWR